MTQYYYPLKKHAIITHNCLTFWKKNLWQKTLFEKKAVHFLKY